MSNVHKNIQMLINTLKIAFHYNSVVKVVIVIVLYIKKMQHCSEEIIHL